MSLSASVIWITGLSGAGKSTVAKEVVNKLREKNIPVLMLDGDELREVLGHLNQQNLHDKNSRVDLAYRYSRLCKMVSDQGITVVIATISMFKEIHDWNRKNMQKYLEVYLKVPIEELKKRDPKGLYKKFEAGQISNIAGLDLEIDEPQSPDLLVQFDNKNAIQETVNKIMNIL